MENTNETSKKRILQPHGWLAHAATADDYYRQKHARVDTSIWALLFTVVPPVGFVLGILGVVRGFKAEKNTTAIVTGFIAIIIAIAAPIIFFAFVLGSLQTLFAGERIESPAGFSVKVPQDSYLTVNNETGVEYRLKKGDKAENLAQLMSYGVYSISDEDSSAINISSSSQSIKQSLTDNESEYYGYWVYNLFESQGFSVQEVLGAREYKDTLEVNVSLSDGYYVVAALHFVEGGMFVQYLVDDGALSGVLVTEEFLGDLVTSTDGNAQAWRQLIDSFEYED